MANLIFVSDPADPRLHDFVGLRDVQLRLSKESSQGLFIAEGEKVIRRAFAAGYQPRSLLLSSRWLESLSDIVATQPELTIYVSPEAITEQLTGFHVHRGALGSFARKPPCQVAELLHYRRLVVAEDIVDHTNVGAILRSAAALGWDACLLSPRCADPLYRRSIKVSMGAVFTLPWARIDDHHVLPDLLHEAGYVIAALALTPDALPLADFTQIVHQTQAKVALLLGSEGPGLSRDWLEQADHRVIIPMAAGVDSLNVAAASAVACYTIGST